MTGFDEGPISQIRTEAAQVEWERNRRVIDVHVIGIRQSVTDIEHVFARLDLPRASSAADERDLRRALDNIRSCVDELTSDRWLKSPKAMADERTRARANAPDSTIPVSRR